MSRLCRGERPSGRRVSDRLCLAYTSDNENVIASGAEPRENETRKRTGLDMLGCGVPKSLWLPLGEAEGHWWRPSPRGEPDGDWEHQG